MFHNGLHFYESAGPRVILHVLFHHGEMTRQNPDDRVGVTRQTINAIEAAKYSPSLELAFRIAEVFNVPVTEVFQYERE